MLTLNLVSQELKEEIKSRHLYALLKKMNFILTIIIIIIAIILLSAKIILQNNFNKVVEQTTLLTGNSGKKYADKVRKINARLQTVSQIQNERVPWSRLVEALAEITPGGVALSYLKLDEKNMSVKLRGKAKTREELLALKNNLENSKIFSNVKSPIKNILRKEDIDFELTADIDADNITDN